jgi:hypothetical protein
MKKMPKVNEFNVTINNKNYIVDIRELERSKAMSNCIKYTCMTFDSEMVPFKRFTIVYNYQDRTYWAWTGNVIRENERLFMEQIAELLNNGILKMAS